MRKIKEVLRLKYEAGCGNRDIVKSLWDGPDHGIPLPAASRACRPALAPPHQFGLDPA
ncbi:hypothetical protein DFAR_1560017 [Desulfarculales bacterium]